MNVKTGKNELFGFFIGENIDTVYNHFVEIYYDNEPLLAGEFYTVIENIDEFYFHSTIKKVVKKGNILKFYLTQ